jgi:hypothetical protein
MFHVYIQTFDVTENVEHFEELNVPSVVDGCCLATVT